MNERKFNGVDELELGHSEALEDERKPQEIRSSLVSQWGNATLGEQRLMVENLPKPKEAMRFDGNKLRFDLLPTEGITELARVYTMGALKYADNNWRNGMKFTRCIASLERHWNLWKMGQSIDPETGCHHLAQVCWNAMTLLVYCLTKTGTDDRTKYQVDENFNIVDNHLGIGLSKDKIQELSDKYKSQREKV